MVMESGSGSYKEGFEKGNGKGWGGFDPHYADGCFVLECFTKSNGNGSGCPHYAACKGAEARHERETARLVDDVNFALALDGAGVLDELRPGDDTNMRHAIAEHGYRFNNERGVFEHFPGQVKRGPVTYTASGDLTNPEISASGSRVSLYK